MEAKPKYPAVLIRNFGLLLTWQGALFTLMLGTCVGVVLSWADSSVAAIIQRNSVVAAFLSFEVKRESSNDLATARETQAQLIKLSIKELETPAIRVLGWINPKYSPTKQLTPAIEVLVGSKGGKLTDRQALNRSCEILQQVGESWSLGDKRVASLWTYGITERLQMAKAFMNKFHESIDQFDSEKNLSSAESACMNSRFAAWALLTSWMDHDSPSQRVVSEDFARQLSSLHNKMLKVAVDLPDEDQKRLTHYAENVSVRAKIFASMGSGGIPAGRELLFASLRIP